MEKQFLADVYGICDELLKNAGHSFGIDFMRLNETLMRIGREWKALGLEMSELEELAGIAKDKRLYSSKKK